MSDVAPSVPKTGSRYRAVAAREISPELLDRLLADPSAPLTAIRSETIKDGDTTLVVKTPWSLEGESVPVAYKCVRRLGWLKRLTQALGENRTRRTYRAGLQLRELGVPTARPLLLLEPRRWSLSSPTYIATEWLEGTQPLGQVVRRYGRTRDEGRLDEVAATLGRTLGRMHRAAGTHRDLKPENIMVRLAQGPEEEDGLWLIDLDGLRIRRWISPWRWRRDLSRLAVGIEEADGLRRSIRLRFLQSYLNERGAGSDWKGQWRRLRQATERRARQRRRRP